MRLPHTGALDRLARFADLHPVPILEQLVAVELWTHLDQTVTDRVARLRVQRDVLVDGARRHGLTVRDPEGGLVCWIDIGKPVAPSLAARMTERGLPIAPGSLFSALPTTTSTSASRSPPPATPSPRSSTPSPKSSPDSRR